LARALTPAASIAFAAACQGPLPNPDLSATPRSASAPAKGATDSVIGDAPVVRAEELLEGRFPGVVLSRLPNGGLTVRIRGTSSVLGSNEPLYVVDGMPIEPGPGGALFGLNPADIDKITVLKDVGSTSLYGVRGANGVVVITTKR
jgi:iron complex outermembrane receptor protein